MANAMTLTEAIRQAGTVEDDVTAPLTIFARKIANQWRFDSPAVILNNPCDGRPEEILPSELAGFDYFLELSVVTEVIDGRLAQLGVDEIDESEIVRTVIHYADNDCWPPVP